MHVSAMKAPSIGRVAVYLLKQWLVRLVLLLCLTTILSACSAGAAPCRVTADAVKTVPSVGDIVGAVFEACGEIID